MAKSIDHGRACTDGNMSTHERRNVGPLGGIRGSTLVVSSNVTNNALS